MQGFLKVLAVSFLFSSFASAEDISWTEAFADDPVVQGRFHVPPGHDAGRFVFDAGNQWLVAAYDTSAPTAWYVRPISEASLVELGRCDDFSFTVTFRIRSQGFYADSESFAQIAWGLVHSQTTGDDRAGGSAGPFSYDLVSLDYYPNVTSFGGPTLGPTIIHSDTGAGFFSSIDFPFGAESDINAAAGDAAPALDTLHTASVEYDSAAQTATVRLDGPGGSLAINADGAGGPGGPDADAATIQTTIFIDTPFSVDSFALTAWEDTFDFDPEIPSVVADVEFSQISFFARTLVPGDLNRDGAVNGLDIAPFIETLLSPDPSACAERRADFNQDEMATVDDVDGFVAALEAN